MDDMKRVVYESIATDLPILRLVIGDIPSPEPDRKDNTSQPISGLRPEKKGLVQRIIAHLENE